MRKQMFLFFWKEKDWPEEEDSGGQTAEKSRREDKGNHTQFYQKFQEERVRQVNFFFFFFY